MRYDTTILYSCNCFEKLQTQQASKFVVHFMTFNYTLYKTNRCFKRLYTIMNTIYIAITNHVISNVMYTMVYALNIIHFSL